jgi:pyruvate/2-oxoacid:ferredoxin oxidoreductase beta subunit
MANIKELSERIPERLSSGHRLCAGCGASIVVRQALMGTEHPVVAVSSTGCLEVATTIYPFTAWEIPFMHNAFENAASTISGIETAYQALKKKGKIKKEIKFVAFGGDGGTYDIGIQALSGALERMHNFVYVCLPPETEIILEDGSIVKIGQLVDESINRYSQKRKIITTSCKNEKPQIYHTGNEGEILESAPIRQSLLSWNGREFLPMEATSAQRKSSPKTLMKITTSSGLTLKLTEEHPVLVDGANGPEWKEAASLKVGDQVYAARKINIFNKDKFYLIDLISENSNIAVTLPPAIKMQINEELRNRFGSIKKAAQHIPFKYWQFKELARNVDLSDLKRIYQRMPKLNWEQLRDNVDEFVARGGNVIKLHQKQLDENMLYLLGLISSDGYMRKENYGITFINKENALIKEFEKAYLKLSKGRKINKIKNNEGIWYITVEDPILYTLAKKFYIKTDPKELLKLPEPLISVFLRGYFDGDGHCSILKHSGYSRAIIILSTTNRMLAKRLRLLLQRLGIVGFYERRDYRFDIHISSKEDIKKFIKLIGSKHPMKKANMNKIKLLLRNRKLQGKYFSLAPKVCGKLLKEICRKNNIPITSIDKKRNICTLAVSKRRASKQKIEEYLSKIEPLVTNEPLMYRIKNFLLDDFYLDPIRQLETIEANSKYVYDFTVEPSHVFVPEGKFVISNCYTNEAYMNTGIQRSGATPKGAATTTAPAGKVIPGKVQFRKDLTAIVAAHRIPYVAQATIWPWNDLVTKAQKAFNVEGPAFLNVLSMCHRGWRYPQENTVNIAKLAVETGYWPLIEVENGTWRFTYKPKERKPVDEFLKTQGRFKHLYKEENKHIIAEIQQWIDKNWTRLERFCEASCRVA